MSNEGSQIGKHLKAWGPNTHKDKPDVDGVVVGERDNGFIEVKEVRYQTNTLVNPHGGWFILTISCLALVACMYLPDNAHA